MDNHEIVHIAIAPPVTVEANLISQLSAIVNKDLYATRLLLAGKIPRIIAHYQDVRAAESAALRLRSLGLIVIVCQDSELRRIFPSTFRAHALKFGQQEIVFQDRSGTARTIHTENVFLILKGIRQIYTQKQITKTKKQINLAATLLTGGFPVRSKVEEKTVETSTQAECFVRLYHRNSPEPDLEITQHSFDYSCLGANMSAVTLANFNTLCEKIKELCPHSVFDDKLTESPRLGVSSAMFRDNHDIQCKLIYLYQDAISSPDSSA